MARRPGNHFKPWTADEVGELKRLIAEGIPLRAVARALGRTPGAVRVRATIEGFSLRRSPDARPTTPPPNPAPVRPSR